MTDTAIISAIKEGNNRGYSMLVKRHKSRLYDVADLAVYNKMKEFDATFPYEDFGLLADDQDSTYFKERLIIYSDPGKAVTGYGHRFWTFQNNDTIIFKQ